MPTAGFFDFDGLAFLVLLIVALTSFFVAWGAFGVSRLWDLYGLILLLIMLSLAMTGAANVLLFYILWEVLAFALWGLGRWAGTADRQTMLGPLPLQGFGAIGSLGMCGAVIMLALSSRSLSMQGLVFDDIRAGTLLLLVGILFKSFALVAPAWYPNRDGRSFFSAHGVLAGGGLLAVGVYPYLRLLFDNMAHRQEWREPAFNIGMAIALLLALAALGEHDVPKLFAFATFSQFGGLIAFFALLRPVDTPLITIVLLLYALAIAGLSLCLGAVSALTGKRDIRQMGALLKRMPVLASVFLLCALSLAGLPPLGGFVGRLIVGSTVLARGGTEQSYLFFALGLLTLCYLLRLFHALFLRDLPLEMTAARATKWIEQPTVPRAPLSIVFVAGALALVLFIIGILPAATVDVIRIAMPSGLH